MIYTIKFDLNVDDENIYSEEQITDFLKETITIAYIDNVKIIDIND